MTAFGTIIPHVMDPEPEQKPAYLVTIRKGKNVYKLELDQEKEWLYFRKEGAKKYLRIQFENRYHLLLSAFVEQLEEINA